MTKKIYLETLKSVLARSIFHCLALNKQHEISLRTTLLLLEVTKINKQ